MLEEAVVGHILSATRRGVAALELYLRQQTIDKRDGSSKKLLAALRTLSVSQLYRLLTDSQIRNSSLIAIVLNAVVTEIGETILLPASDCLPNNVVTDRA